MLYAIKYFTEVYNFKNDIIPNYYQLIQACGNINILFYDKKKYEVNKLVKMEQQKLYTNIKQKVQSEEEKRQEKAELKRLKQIAEEKIQRKITRVEMIDSLILSGDKK